MILETSGGSKLLDPNFLFDKIGLHQGMQVADLGCGSIGHFVFPIARIVGKEGKVFAVDIQKSILQNIEKRAEIENLQNNILAVWSDLERYGATAIPSKSVDFSLLINILFQNKDRESILKEAVRLLKVGGRVLVVDWLLSNAPFGPPVEGRVDPIWVEQTMDKLGMKMIMRFSASKYHYALVFEK